jgi:hypothetical protein
MSVSELHEWIGSDEQAYGPPCVKEVRTKTSLERVKEDAVQTVVYRTPAGTLTSVDRYDPISDSRHPIEFPVKSVQDIEAMSLFFADARPEFDPVQFERAKAFIEDLGEDGLASASIGISPLMWWIQLLAGIENGLLMVADHQQEVEALFERMHNMLCRTAEIIADKSPYEVIYSVENTSTTLISPQLFKRYCCGHLMDYGRIVNSAGKLHVLHMCGKIKSLLPDVAGLPAAGIEALTSSPVGNATLLDGRSACPDKSLCGGTNATLWMATPETILTTIESDLDVLPHQRGIFLSSAGVMPPACRPETIREVAEWVKHYPVR